MTRALLYLWRHPRRTGFLAFNLVVVALLIAWGYLTNQMSQQGIASLPNLALGYTGMAIAIAALIGGWLAWAVMVTRRHAHLASPAERDAGAARNG
jgi:protein-S-isoprenylcysteine O-methyltransferase Ste14